MSSSGRNKQIFIATAYTSAIFTSAFLLFLIQPLFGKMVLPVLGGAPAAWITCMLYYQAVLLAGYAFAHLLTKIQSIRWQIAIQLAVLAVPLLALPIALPVGLDSPESSMPIVWLLGLLTTCVGLPIFAVSTCSPLLQRWFSFTEHDNAHDPYFLYAAGNVGSFIALLSYPFFFEVFMTTKVQSTIWSWVYVSLIFLFLVVIFFSLRNSVSLNQSTQAPPSTDQNKITRLHRMHWIFIAFIPSSLMLGTTSYITTDIAAIPLIWIIPLALYLLTFTIAFSPNIPIPKIFLLWLMMLLASFNIVNQLQPGNFSISVSILLSLLLLFIAALLWHRRLADLRPHTSKLTEYYLMISIGGVLGGVFNAILAPVFFNTQYEYSITIALTFLLWLEIYPATRANAAQVGRSLTEAVLSIIAIVVWAAMLYEQQLFLALSWHYELSSGIVFLLFMGCAIAFLRKPIVVTGIFLITPILLMNIESEDEQLLLQDRSFYGSHTVVKLPYGVIYHHGTTTHGLQCFGRRQCEPITYYKTIDNILKKLNVERRVKDVAVIGLGTGTLAAYTEAGQHWVFYEIDPLVKDIALNKKYFTFLTECVNSKAEVSIRIGDGRLLLAKERDQKFDMIILDAFNSDAIPVHLLTKEAMQLYLQKIKPSGLIMVHITNKYLDLSKIIAAVSRDLGLTAFDIEDYDVPEDSIDKYYSRWIAVFSDSYYETLLSDIPHGKPLQPAPSTKPWTDQNSNIVSVLDKNSF